MPVDIKQFLRGLAAAERRIVNAALRGLDVAGEHVIGDSQQLTPVKTGALQGSATTLPAEARGTQLVKTIGHNTNYAAAVHERLELNHKIGQAKFLETAIARNTKKVEEFVGNTVKKALENN